MAKRRMPIGCREKMYKEIQNGQHGPRIYEGEWLDSSPRCDFFDGNDECGRSVTHVIFLNTPYDRPYVVTTCSMHKNADDFPTMPLRLFLQRLDKLKISGVKPKDLALEVARTMDPGLKDL